MRKSEFLIILVSLSLIPIISIKAEQFRYYSHGKRDPFVPLIGQDKASSVVALSEIMSIDDVELEGIAAQTLGEKAAIINGELVKENFRAGELEIKKITKNSVTLTISGKEYTINLPEEGGLVKKSEE